jgi:hypothetical protein
LALYSPLGANAGNFLTDSVLALVVGDGQYCPLSPSNTTCNYFTAPIQLIEYTTITPGASSVQSISLPVLSISANDWYLGQMQPCADGSCAVFSAQETAPYSNIFYPGQENYVGGILTRPYINGNRVMVRIKTDGTVDMSTKIDAANYDGIIKGVCAQDSSGFWIAGNATGNKGIIYMNSGAVNTHTVVYKMQPVVVDPAILAATLEVIPCTWSEPKTYAYVDTPNPATRSES